MDITPIDQLVQHAGSYSEKEGVLLKNAVDYHTFKKKDVLLNIGKVCSSWFFIVSGSIIQYHVNTESQKNIIDLNVAHDWVINHKSFTSRKPSKYIIEAYEDTMVYELSMDNIHQLIGVSPVFFQLGKILDGATARIDFFDHQHTPDEKYRHTLENRPELIQKFPQKLIASYLKMTPETLSRVRNRFLRA